MGRNIMISKEDAWKGLKLELSNEEICKMFQAKTYEKDYYYDYNLLMDTLV